MKHESSIQKRFPLLQSQEPACFTPPSSWRWPRWRRPCLQLPGHENPAHETPGPRVCADIHVRRALELRWYWVSSQTAPHSLHTGEPQHSAGALWLVFRHFNFAKTLSKLIMENHEEWNITKNDFKAKYNFTTQFYLCVYMQMVTVQRVKTEKCRQMEAILLIHLANRNGEDLFLEFTLYSKCVFQLQIFTFFFWLLFCRFAEARNNSLNKSFNNSHA